MLNKKEEEFLQYWEQQRKNKKKYLRKVSIGLPLGVMIAAAIFINFLSGWYKRADMDIRTHSSVIVVVLIALLGIVVFITIFSAHYRWDQNEMQYKELLFKKKKEEEDHV